MVRLFEYRMKMKVAAHYYEKAITRRLLARVDEYILQNKIWLREGKSFLPARRRNRHHPYERALDGYRSELQNRWQDLEDQYESMINFERDTYHRRLVLDVL